MPLVNHWWYPLSLALSANIGWTFVTIGNLNTEATLPSICQTGGGLIWVSNKNWSLGNFEVQRELVAGWQQRARLFAWAASCRNWTIELRFIERRKSQFRVFLVYIWHSCQSRGNRSHRKWIYSCMCIHISGSECMFADLTTWIMP